MTQTADAVFSGGGIKGLAFAGAIQAAEEAGYGEWEQLAGTSAGAICATALALGYDAAGLKKLFSSDFAKINDPLPLGIPNYFGHGIVRGKGLTKWIESVVSSAPVKAKTYGDLPIGKLQVIGTDIIHQRMVVFPRDAGLYLNPATGNPYRPDSFPLALAARISAGYPVFFPPVVLKDVKTRKDGWLVDGGVTSGFPVFLFDDPKPLRPTWGFELHDGPAYNPISGIGWIVPYVLALINTSINALDDLELRDFGDRVVAIDARGVNALDFSLSEAQKKALYDAGYSSAKIFFATKADSTNRFGKKPGILAK